MGYDAAGVRDVVQNGRPHVGPLGFYYKLKLIVAFYKFLSSTNGLDHMLLMTSYLVVIATDYHKLC